MSKYVVLLGGSAVVLLDQVMKQVLLRTAYVFDITIFSVQAELHGGIVSSWFGLDNKLVSLTLSTAVILLFGAVVWRERNAKRYLPLVLILAGGISNVMDRAIYGQVVDVLHVGLLSTNGADIAVVIGVLGVLTSVVLPQT